VAAAAGTSLGIPAGEGFEMLAAAWRLLSLPIVLLALLLAGAPQFAASQRAIENASRVHASTTASTPSTGPTPGAPTTAVRPDPRTEHRADERAGRGVTRR
jgi:hypothetical protein